MLDEIPICKLSGLVYLQEVVANENSAFSFLREKNVFESSNVKCSNCESTIYERLRSQRGVQKPIWKCKKHGCSAVRSIRASNYFVFYTAANGCIRYNLSLCKIMELVWYFRHIRMIVGQAAFNAEVGTHTVV